MLSLGNAVYFFTFLSNVWPQDLRLFDKAQVKKGKSSQNSPPQSTAQSRLAESACLLRSILKYSVFELKNNLEVFLTSRQYPKRYMFIKHIRLLSVKFAYQVRIQLCDSLRRCIEINVLLAHCSDTCVCNETASITSFALCGLSVVHCCDWHKVRQKLTSTTEAIPAASHIRLTLKHHTVVIRQEKIATWIIQWKNKYLVVKKKNKK